MAPFANGFSCLVRPSPPLLLHEQQNSVKYLIVLGMWQAATLSTVSKLICTVAHNAVKTYPVDLVLRQVPQSLPLATLWATSFD